jgi:MYXO-CTERM domain-containing protein
MSRWLSCRVGSLLACIPMLLATALPARAQSDPPIKPRVILMFDTSGSMRWTICGWDNFNDIRGDNSAECQGRSVSCTACPGALGCGDGLLNDARLFKVKQGASSVVDAFGEVSFALARFHQEASTFRCGTALGSHGGWSGAPSTYDCNQDAIGTGWNSADVLVGFADNNHRDVLAWMNNCDDYTNVVGGDACPQGVQPGQSGHPDTPSTGCNSPPHYGGSCDLELRATGVTPIAGSLRYLRESFLPAVLAADPQSACRPYRVILLTDGEGQCTGSPPAEAAALLAGTGLSGKSIPVHVIGFASAPLQASLDAIARDGGTGSAIMVDNEISLALAMVSIISESILTESCDGLDNDCDGQCDEVWPQVAVTDPSCSNQRSAQSCTVGVGICRRTGNYRCRADGTGIECSATPGPAAPAEICDNLLDDNCNGQIDEGCIPCVPEPEICDGKDNDCDGLVDAADPDFAFLPTPCGSDIGACARGTTACISGSVVCQGATGPSTELCDNIDNNCDTVVDNFSERCYPFTDNGCNLQAGTCQGVCTIGNRLCSQGSFGSCIGAVGSTAEVCNGLDDDCDGQVDEGVANNCIDYTTCATFRSCAACPLAPAEVCDGQDNDCDGNTDNVTRACSTLCGRGTETCNFSNDGNPLNDWTGCNAPQPSAEVCDGIDNDCNGSIDDNVPGMGVACGGNTGECKQGVLQCVGGKQVCVGEVGPRPEVCDGKDNDCDGTPDNNLTLGTCGSDVGECKRGQQQCQRGILVCIGHIGPKPEICDGKDNDCNGQIDDNPTDAGTTCGSIAGECKTGTMQCQAGSLVCTGAVGPQPEICDGKDNDCNGATDDGIAGVGTSCGSSIGECKPGALACQNVPGSGWSLVCAGAIGPSQEICDGKDNNCNGQIDEIFPEKGQSCGSTLGECSAGTYRCVNGLLDCDGGRLPQPEICDGKDNDCNGSIDDNTQGDGDACGSSVGECKQGVQRCVGAQFVCLGGVGPRDEICDGKDNDCDGTTDDQAECAGSNECVEGQCKLPCGIGEFKCPGGRRCINGYCEIDPCSGVSCPDNQRCIGGTCIEKCANVDCAAHQKCEPKTGRCIDDSCLSKGCPSDQVCVNYQCIANPCPEGKCPSNQMCADGQCHDTCLSVACAPSQTCVAGKCIDEPCEGYPCQENFRCVEKNGSPSCEPDPCRAVRCAPGQICRDGKCQSDPCATARCPSYLRCEVSYGGLANCVRKAGTPVPTTTTMLAGGGGGVACAVGDSSTAAPLWPLLLLLALAIRQTRRR